MMEKLIYYMDISLMGLYLILFGFYLKNFLSNHPSRTHLFTLALPLVLVFHLVKLSIQGVTEGHCPLVGINEAFSFAAFALCIIYFIVERYQRYFGTGAIFIGLIFIFQAISVFARASVTTPLPGLNNVPTGFHAPIALIAFAALTTSAIYSIIYLALHHRLKKKHFSPNLKRIPPLETIERMQALSATVGVALLALALVLGIVMGFFYKQFQTILDAKIVISFIILAIFGYGVIGSWCGSFSDKKKSVIIIIGFLFALISMTIVRFYLPTFHRF